MKLLRLYARVLGLLGPKIRLGWALAFANLALATAMFAEPFKEFPPVQHANTFTVDDALAKMRASVSGD